MVPGSDRGGAPERSLLPRRAERRDARGMPPLASAVADAEGVALLDAWIATLEDCPAP